MSALAELQARWLDAMLGRADESALLPLLASGAGVPAARRLQVYRHNLFESLHAALAAVYPVVRRLVGDDCFAALARCVVQRHPSRSGDLHDFGAALAEVVRDWPPTAALPYLGDVAALEWACHEVHPAPDAAPLAPAMLASLDAGSTLALRPAARLVASPWPVLRIWQANQPGGDGAVSLAEGGVRLLVLRPGLEIVFVALGAAEERWLRALAASAALGAATQAALDADAAFDLGTTLARHLALGSFAAPRP